MRRLTRETGGAFAADDEMFYFFVEYRCLVSLMDRKKAGDTANHHIQVMEWRQRKYIFKCVLVYTHAE